MDQAKINVFKDKVYKKYNKDDVIIKSTKDNIIVFRKKDNDILSIIGCVLCFNAKLKYDNGMLFINKDKALPITSFIENDSNNPILKMIFVCPKCKKIIVRPDVSKMPLLGKVEEWME